MPSDIFISYSSKDKEKADQLSELLASAGLSVWIDQSGIEIATSWSGEIVDAIENCKAFVVLLSPASIESKNVVREVSLAFEKNKKILPLDLEPVALSRDLQYLLAGIQRAPMTNIDAIIRAIGKLGLEATQAPTLKLVKESDGRKSLMILPFEDLSPTGDNGWFADGIVSELIQALSTVKSLHVTDSQTTKDFKRYQGTLPTYAKEMGIRYFVEGDVRKFGDQIKVNSRLLDIETGDHLWQDSMKGTMDDIFDIQEKVAEKVVEGLKVHLASDEKEKLIKHGTGNAEAYELFLKAQEYFDLQTKEGWLIASQLYAEAIQLDPEFSNAFSALANMQAVIYRNYDPDPDRLVRGEELCKEALRLNPELSQCYHSLMMIYLYQGRLTEAEETAKDYIQKYPDDFTAYFSLGFFYGNTGQQPKAIGPMEQAVLRKPDNLVGLFNLVLACAAGKEREKTIEWATEAIPLEARRLKLHPDDETSRMRYALLLYHAEKREETLREIEKLKKARDGFPLFNTAALLAQLGDKHEAIRIFRRAIDAGYRNRRSLVAFFTDEDGVGSLAGTPEYEEAKRIADEILNKPDKKISG